MAIHATQNPIRLEPLSPRKTPRFFPKKPILNIKKPIIEPIIKTSIESYINPEWKPIRSKAIIAQPEHKPLMPSIILKEFMTPTMQKTVNGIPAIPKFISPNQNKFHKDSR